MTTTLCLVRHGEAASSDAADPGLTEHGRRQAEAVATRLARLRIDGLVHGPKRRARETAEIIGAHLPHVSLAWSEHADDRTPVPTDRSSVPERYWPFLTRVPAAERDPDGRQLDAAVDHLGAVGSRDRSVIVVSHAFVIGWFVRRAVDAPPWRWIGLNHLNGAVTTIQYTTEGARLVAFNDSGHLPPTAAGPDAPPEHVYGETVIDAEPVSADGRPAGGRSDQGASRSGGRGPTAG
jgi:serine/threonine-protein phosphatase PGAM5